MGQRAILALVLLAFLVVNHSVGYCQSDDADKAKKHEQEAYEKQKELKKSIKKNQTAEDIVPIMGEPEETEVVQKGSDVIDVWYYEGRDVRIEFKNDKVSNWHIRFMPDKPPKEKQKEPPEKCSLCEKSKSGK